VKRTLYSAPRARSVARAVSLNARCARPTKSSRFWVSLVAFWRASRNALKCVSEGASVHLELSAAYHEDGGHGCGGRNSYVTTCDYLPFLKVSLTVVFGWRVA
jgi:hypothetical protein